MASEPTKPSCGTCHHFASFDGFRDEYGELSEDYRFAEKFDGLCIALPPTPMYNSINKLTAMFPPTWKHVVCGCFHPEVVGDDDEQV